MHGRQADRREGEKPRDSSHARRRRRPVRQCFRYGDKILDAAKYHRPSSLRRKARIALELFQEVKDVVLVAGVPCVRDDGVAFGVGGGGGSPGGEPGGDCGCFAGAPGSANWREDNPPLDSAAHGPVSRRPAKREWAVCETTLWLRTDHEGTTKSRRPGPGS